ncbi:hypothetical protein DPMN_175795 [Dreissena polymorpha]|uniref:Secreted protein n=1 Tax=Dreissena polymorpha TaxID=45954 RepID=A0A9D4E796_DREPO|nr:hypothetical protein DPMN_175795 [Dreissena polymorpha]
MWTIPINAFFSTLLAILGTGPTNHVLHPPQFSQSQPKLSFELSWRIASSGRSFLHLPQVYCFVADNSFKISLAAVETGLVSGED